MKGILAPGESIRLDQPKNLPMPTVTQWGNITLLFHDPVFQEGYEAGRNTCIAHLYDERPRTAITDFTLQALFVTTPIPADCTLPLSWQLGYYLGYVMECVLYV